jgi:hypothetical protein
MPQIHRPAGAVHALAFDGIRNAPKGEEPDLEGRERQQDSGLDQQQQVLEPPP